MMSLLTVSAVFLRWLPTHGPAVVALISFTALTAFAIYLTQRRRYLNSAERLRHESAEANVRGILLTTVAMAVIGMTGLVLIVVA